MLLKKIYGCLLGGLIGDAMGAPVENWHYERIRQEHGELNTFAGDGTDDSAVKQLICDALIENGGHIRADHFAQAILDNPRAYDLFYIPVRNMYHKLKEGVSLPVDAGFGNMQSSSSAMAISPMGIVNACNPRQAALETYDVAGLIHSGPTNFCRDAACAMAAATAEAMRPDATVDGVLAAATAYLHPQSAKIIVEHIARALALAKEAGSYEAFREQFYKDYLYGVICDSRETVPAALAIFYLCGGDATKCIIAGANFGRDADTIASMVGALSGAFGGVGALRPDWVAQIEAGGGRHAVTAQKLAGLARAKAAQAAQVDELLASI